MAGCSIMKKYDSEKYKYIKQSAKVGNSRSNIVVLEKNEKVVRVSQSKGCGGCSRSPVKRNTVKKIKRV